MSTKKKIVISVLAICLTSAIITSVVYAALTQRVGINTVLSFTAGNLSANVAIYGTNGSTDIDFGSNANTLGYDSGAFNNGGASSTINSFSISSSDSTKNVIIPYQDFDLDGDHIPSTITLVVVIQQQGSDFFKINLKPSTLSAIEDSTDNVNASYTVEKNNVVVDDGVRLVTDEMVVYTFTFSVINSSENASFNAQIGFDLVLANAE